MCIIANKNKRLLGLQVDILHRGSRTLYVYYCSNQLSGSVHFKVHIQIVTRGSRRYVKVHVSYLWWLAWLMMLSNEIMYLVQV